MLKKENIYVQSLTFKNVEGFSMLDHVTTLIRVTELSKMESKSIGGKKAAELRGDIEKEHADLDAMTCEDSVIVDCLKADAAEFLAWRKELLALRTEVANMPISMEDISALPLTDRVHITLMAHAVYPSVLLSEDLFDPEKGGVDMSKAITSYFKNGKINSDIKNDMKNVFNKVLGAEGDYFYGMNLKRSDFDAEDLRHFLARFSKHAKWGKTINKETKAVTWKDYKYRTKTDKKEQQKAFTELCAVIIHNAGKHSVVKPEESQNEEVKAETEA